MSKPNEGFDLDSYDFTEYASALDGEKYNVQLLITLNSNK
jgi:hypothetical protein